MAAAGGEEAAFGELYARYADPLRQYFVRSLSGNVMADDLVQQVFIQLLGSQAFRQPRRGPDSLHALLFTIAKNLVRNQVRGDSRRSEREERYRSRQSGIEPPPEVTDESVDRAIAALPDHHRRPLLLRFRHGMSVKDIAALLDCAPGTVKSRLHYALKRLTQIMNPAPQEDQPPRT
jgi:RNA polymerase sigma-70 factor (ECF subfamily)